MSILERLSDESCWEDYYEYKVSLTSAGASAERLRSFIDRKEYLPVCRALEEGKPFPLPRKAVISKMSSGKKRTVYTYPEPENTVLKLLTYLLIRRFDGLFGESLYSFRPGRTAKDAVARLMRTPGLAVMYSYKADIHNYFNSVPAEEMVSVLREVLAEDPGLESFLRGLLMEPMVLWEGRAVEEEKGIMAGTPLSAFFANLYLRDLDAALDARKIRHARYSDDIILFAGTREEALGHAAFLRSFLEGKGLSLNPEKECLSSPEEGWTFLGFSVKDGKVDIAPATVRKLKAKMRRKTRALMRWRKRKGRSGEQAAAAFTRIFNRKLLEGSGEHMLTWRYWFFPMINCTDGLHEIDLYAQECLRYLVSGRRTSSRFNVRYEDLKRLGYRSLVHEYFEKRVDKDAGA